MRKPCLLFACSVTLLACGGPAFVLGSPMPGEDSAPSESAAGPGADSGAPTPTSSDAGDSKRPLSPVRPDAMSWTGSETSSEAGLPLDGGIPPEGSPDALSPGLDGGGGIPQGCAVVACAPRDLSCCQGQGFASYCGGYGAGWLCCQGACP